MMTIGELKEYLANLNDEMQITLHGGYKDDIEIPLNIEDLSVETTDKYNCGDSETGLKYLAIYCGNME